MFLLWNISSHLPLSFFTHNTVGRTKFPVGPQGRTCYLWDGWWRRLPTPFSPLAEAAGRSTQLHHLRSHVQIFPAGELSRGQDQRGEQLHLAASLSSPRHTIFLENAARNVWGASPGDAAIQKAPQVLGSSLGKSEEESEEQSASRGVYHPKRGENVLLLEF